MKPNYKIISDDSDVTENFKGRGASITITDDFGYASDTAKITVSNVDGKVAFPRRGAHIELFLGFGDALRSVGNFIVDETAISGPPDKMEISAKGATFFATEAGKAMQSRKSRSWDKTTLGAVAASMAADYGLTLAASAEAQAMPIDHEDQIDEGDFSFLTRMAARIDHLAKPAFGRLAIVRKGQGLTASGKAIPDVNLTRPDLSTWSAVIGSRTSYKSVVATYHDRDGGKTLEVSAGAGEPVLRLSAAQPSKAEAQQMAEAQLAEMQRYGNTLKLTLPWRPDIVVDGRILITGMPEGVNGEWWAEKVQHTFDGSGLRLSVDARSNRLAHDTTDSLD